MGSRQNPVKGFSSVQGKLECTPDCRWAGHASVVLSASFLGNLKLLQHCATICANPFQIQDSTGRNALHVAASCGHISLLRWLVGRKKTKVNVQDWESKWTALHRSVFFGQLGASVLLIKQGANLNAVDNDGYTPISLLNANREIIKKNLSVDCVMVHTWGRNPNTTLGHDRSRGHPERLDLPLPRDTSVVQIVLCKFHTVMLTSEGCVLTCGHGLGGRLGHNSEQSIVTPRCVETMEGFSCVGVAAARNHTVILTKGGAVFTCGINDAHQLGQGHNPASAPTNCLAPKQIKVLKSRQLVAVGAGRFHTAMCTETELYTVGQNLGQLGYKKRADTQVAPRVVPGVNLEEGDTIRRMSASDSATAVLSRRHHVFVCTGFTVRHIRFGFLDKVSCMQFEVCASLSDRDHLRQVETEPTKVLLLDSEHKLWLWQPLKKVPPSLLPGFARHNVVQFSLGRSLTVVTEEGEVFKTSASFSQVPSINLQRVPYIQNARAVFTDFKGVNFAYLQNVYRSPFLPVISAGTLASDVSSLLEEVWSSSDILLEVGEESFTAHKFFLSSQTRSFLSHLHLLSDHGSTPVPTSSQPHLWHSSYELSGLCDDPAVFDAFLHYVYGSHIRLLPLYNQKAGVEDREVMVDSGTRESVGDIGTVLSVRAEFTPDTSSASLDDNDWTEEYDQFASNDPLDETAGLEGSIHLMSSTPKRKVRSRAVGRSGDTPSQPAVDSSSQKVLHLYHRQQELRALLDLASSCGLSDLQTKLERLLNSKAGLNKPQVLLRLPLDLKRHLEFSDLTLVSVEGKSLHCHKCLMVARSEYFRSMLLMGWKESLEGPAVLSLPVNYNALKAVIDFIYTDELRPPNILGNDAVDWTMSVLIIADQLLLTRLKELCELSLAKSLNLRNAVDFLEFSEVYSAHQLKKSCLQFICVNAACLFEGRYSDGIPTSLLEPLSRAYRDLIPALGKRTIRFTEPRVETLPESYFRDSGLGDEVLSGASDEEGESVVMATDKVADLSYQSGSSLQDTVSPRAASNSRRKRKRKNSHSENRGKQGSTSRSSQSPMNDKELSETGSGNHSQKESLSPPIDDLFSFSSLAVTPEPLLSPKSPLELDSRLSAKSPAELRCAPKSSSQGRPRRSSTPDSKVGGGFSPTPLPGTQGQKSSGGATPSYGPTVTPASCGNDNAKASSSKTVLVAQPRQAGRNSSDFNTPSSSGPGGKGKSKRKNGGSAARMRLTKKFEGTVEVTPGAVARNVEEVSDKATLDSTTSAPVKGAWSSVKAPLKTSCLRDIMAKEEEVSNKQQRQRSPSCGTATSSSHSEIDSVHFSSKLSGKVAKSEPIAVSSSRGRSKEGSVSPSVSASPSNPWKKSGSSPTVSMRNLMAEAEAEEKQSRRKASVNKDKSIMRLLEPKLNKQHSVPPISPHQPPLSFASIIKSQEKSEKRNKMVARKAFPLIQIEEQAVLDLRRAYSADDNPDEYIRVERFQKVKFSNQTLSSWGSTGR